MPEPENYENEDDWMAACVPVRIDEGDDQKQAVAVCLNIWRERKSIDPAAVEIPTTIKVGARTSTEDRRRVRAIRKAAQDIQGLTVEIEPLDADPVPNQPEIVTIDLDTLIAQGKSVKALGEGRIGGYLITFSDATSPDLEGDYFTKDTDFGDAEYAPVYYQHGLDPRLGRRRFGRAAHKIDEFGVWAETQLQMRDEYEKWLYQQAEQEKLAWSSGTAPHLVEREQTGKTWHITSWPLGLDDSMTLTPAEPRNTVIPLKSLGALSPLPVSETQDEPEVGEAEKDKPAASAVKGLAAQTIKQDSQGGVTMPEFTQEQLNELVQTASDAAAEKALKALPVKPEPSVTVTHDPADNPFTSLAETCRAVKAAALTEGHVLDPRLLRLRAMEEAAIKATGASENIPSEAGFLLEPTQTAEVLKPMHETGPFTSVVQKLPVGSNSNFGWINGVDETSRATGSRWGGIRGYRLAEGASITASKPAFRRINWELKKYAVLAYGTDELLADASQWSAVVQQGAGEELSFMANDDIYRGLGSAGPHGVMEAGSLISVAKESGQAADTLVYENLIKMWARLLPASKSRATWYINTDTNPQLDRMSLAVGTGGIEPRFIGYDASGVMRIKGRPVVETEFNATLGDVGDILLADFSSGYLFWEKGGVQAASSIHLQFLTDETVFRFVYRCDGQPVLASALTPYKAASGATLGHFVVVAAR